MAASNEKPKPDAAPVHPWDLPAEEEFDTDGPRTIIARQPGPPEPPKPKKGEVLESMVPEPDPLGGPATLPGTAPTTLPGNTPGAAPEPPPLTAFDSDPQPAFDPPTFAERPSAKLPRSGLHQTEPNPVPVTGSAPVPGAPKPSPPIRRTTGDLGKAAEALRKQTSSGPAAAVRKASGEIKSAEAVRKASGEVKSAPAVRRTTGEIKSAQAVRKTTGEIKSAQAVRKTTGEIKSAQAVRKVSRPSSRIPALADGDETTNKKVDPANASLADSDDTTRKKVPERLAPPIPEVADEEFEEAPDADPGDDELDAPTAERRQVNPRGEEKDPTAPDAQLGDPDLFERTKTGVKPVDPRAKKRLRLVVMALAVLLAAFLLHALYQATRERPTAGELQACYPYGFDGMRGPHGEDAPGAEFMTFEYMTEVTCSAYPTCLRYLYTGQNRFTGTMVVGKGPAGQWVRVGDEGSPFPPRPPE